MDLNIKDIEIPAIGEDKDVFVKGFSIKNIINLIIDFINNLIKFEF